MTRSEQLRQGIEALNARDFAAAGKDYADDVRFHAPGLDLDVEGRETMMQRIGDFIEEADAHYELDEVVEHGPFVVAFAPAAGTIQGQRMAWELCELLRFEGDQVAEAWAVRGGAPQPTSA